jgi:uncharacterized RDD family membrane protein YckC
MTQRRALLLAVAVVWLLLPFGIGALGGNVGPVEFVVWLLGFAALIAAYFTWGRPRQTPC